MGRSRDIAEMLSKTETNNTNNNALAIVGTPLGLDSAEVASVGLKVFQTLDSLPTSNLLEGQQALVDSDKRLYISNGLGWYNIAVVNATPRFDSAPNDEYTIVDSQTPLVITAKALDSDFPDNALINQSFGTDSAQYMVNITNDSSVFTFTPKSADSIGIEVAAGNLTDSNGDFTYTFKWSDGINFVAKAANIIYNTGSGTAANSAVAYRGYSQATFGAWGNSTANATLSIPAGTQVGDQGILVIGGLGWTAGLQSGAVTVPTEFGTTPAQEHNWGYNVGQYGYRTDVYTCSALPSSIVSSGVTVTNNESNPGTSYICMTLITLGGGNVPLYNHAQINYASSYNQGSNYGSYSAARPTGYATKNGIMEVLTTRYGTRTMINYGQSQLQGYVDRNIYYIQAFYKNSSAGLLNQPGHGWTHNGGTIYSASSLVMAY